ENVRARGEQMLIGFKQLQAKYDKIIDVRGLGLLGGISFERASEAVEPITPKIVDEALKRGSICRSVVYGGQDTLAFAPPFIMTEEQMNDMLTIMDES